MKKTLYLVLAFALCLSLCACNNKPSPHNPSQLESIDTDTISFIQSYLDSTKGHIFSENPLVVVDSKDNIIDNNWSVKGTSIVTVDNNKTFVTEFDVTAIYNTEKQAFSFSELLFGEPINFRDMLSFTYWASADCEVALDDNHTQKVPWLFFSDDGTCQRNIVMLENDEKVEESTETLMWKISQGNVVLYSDAGGTEKIISRYMYSKGYLIDIDNNSTYNHEFQTEYIHTEFSTIEAVVSGFFIEPEIIVDDLSTEYCYYYDNHEIDAGDPQKHLSEYKSYLRSNFKEETYYSDPDTQTGITYSMYIDEKGNALAVDVVRSHGSEGSRTYQSLIIVSKNNVNSYIENYMQKYAYLLDR